jgi:hypothetical protein
MDYDAEKLSFPLVVWILCLSLGALHHTESSALSGRAPPEPFTQPAVAFAQTMASTTTPVPSRHSPWARVEGFGSNVKNFFYEPLGRLIPPEWGAQFKKSKTIRKV